MKVFLSLLIFTSALLSQSNVINWFQHQRAPWMIAEGEYKNLGYGDKIRQIFEENLPEYTHKHITVNFSRMESEIKQGKNYCYGPIGRFPIFNKYFHWTDKTIYVLGQKKVLMLKSTYEKLGSPKSVSLRTLLRNESLMYGYVDHFSMYPKMLPEFLGQKNLFSLSSLSPAKQLFKMMTKKRIDWMMDYPFLISWYNFENKTDSGVISIPIEEELQLKVLKAYMACTKNDWGAEKIKKLDKLITKENMLRARGYVRQWQPADGTQKEFDALNKKIYGF